MAPLIVAGIAALVAVLVLFVYGLSSAAAHGDEQLLGEAINEVRFSDAVMFLLALYAIGWEIEQVEWWPFGTLDHDRRTPPIEWTFKDAGQPVEPDEVFTRDDGTVVARWKGA